MSSNDDDERGGVRMYDESCPKVAPLGRASAAGDLNQVRALIASGAEIEEPNCRGETALMLACEEGRLSCVRALIEAGADIHATDICYCFPLMSAGPREPCPEGHPEVVRALLAVRADVEQNDGDCFTALMIAALYGSCEVASMLLAAGATVEREVPLAFNCLETRQIGNQHFSCN